MKKYQYSNLAFCSNNEKLTERENCFFFCVEVRFMGLMGRAALYQPGRSRCTWCRQRGRLATRLATRSTRLLSLELGPVAPFSGDERRGELRLHPRDKLL